MKKRLLKTAIATALTVAFAVPVFAAPAAANPFTDVPAKHWSYDAVNKLAQAGIVDGYGDGTFRGDKTMTRYEMATIVAKAMTKNLNADQKAVTDKLAKEFGTELNSLGVKVAGLEKKVDNMVKISGDARVRHFSTDGVTANTDNTDFRARITFDGKINDNMKINARITSGNVDYNGNPTIALDTANVTFKALGLTNTIGRQDVKLGGGFLYDTSMNALTSNIGNLKLVAGNKSADRIYAAEYNTNLLGAKVAADYYKNDTNNDEIFGARTSFGLLNGVAANAEYFKNDNNDATAAAYGVKFTKLGLTASYRDVEAGALTAYSSMNNDMEKAMLAGGFKGMEVQYDKALDKNTALNVKYQDFKKQDGTEIGARTQATVNVKF